MCNTILKKAKRLAKKFSVFSTGYRMVIMIHRQKDGGNNKEAHRVLGSWMYKDAIEFEKSIFKALWLNMANEQNVRIYASVNSRNIKKSIQYIEKSLLDMHYCNNKDQVTRLYEKVFQDPRTFLMQPSHKSENMFLLDIDNLENVDVLNEVLQKMNSNGIKEVFRTKTRNGWHIVTEPFNPLLLGKYKDIIHKDGLILIK